MAVVEMDVFAYEEARLLIGLKFCSVNALCFENGKEILGKNWDFIARYFLGEYYEGT